ncbi:two component transcriptional regulator, LytTR family [Paenibacillus sophorae]|uniref:LytTR family DNA-binding domain-containing protein n=1 Tax=Paenibacillus sophorae TaxID=1333845 RepID=A0A1H8PIH6_9BACL|nr:LytTR family DNA-binding domain-containing protein [Paenibacillus sophorae]QWU16578.1 LytTR family DNA-binding domain-containing protein [Paenibacillus sophorae]SEO41363.1 two component transcriptional regulator, LytTR family [Paenibacillus sophorae]
MRAIIVEDEELARQELAYLIQANSGIEIVAQFEDGLDALKFLQTKEVDVLFLDINIPSVDGVLLAQNISRFSVKPYIVFITAYKEHAAEAFEIEAFDYILKPYSETRIKGMLGKLEAAFAHRPGGEEERSPVSNKINLWKNEKIIVVDADDIYYASAQEKTTSVFTRNEEYSMGISISEFHGRLPQERFFRCHRSFIVNLSKIKEIIPWFNNTYLLRLRDLDFEVPVSRSKVKEFRQIMRL